MAVLREDPARSIEGIDQLLAYLQELTDRTIADLDGTHFDIPEPLHRVECREAPPGTAAAMYYTAPSADFSRPGRTWYPAKGRTRFPLWTEVTTAYHEGVPGHHLQIGLCMTFQDRLTTFQRQLGIVLRPRRGLGALRRAAHAGARVPREPRLPARDARLPGISRHARHRRHRAPPPARRSPRTRPYRPGHVWDWEIALPFVSRYCGFAGPGFARSELDRYCGMPAQAISYKVGERAWLDIRARASGHGSARVRSEAFPHGRAQPGVAAARSARAGVARSQLTRPHACAGYGRWRWCGGAPAPRHQSALAGLDAIARARRGIARRPCRS